MAKFTDAELKDLIYAAAGGQGSEDALSILTALEKSELGRLKDIRFDISRIDGAMMKSGSILHLAAVNNNIPLAHFALDKLNIEVNALSFSGLTPSHIAIELKHTKILQLLLDHNACVGIYAHGPRPLLHYAASIGDEEIVRQILEVSAHVNLYNVNRNSPLEIAIQHRHIEVARTLLDYKADVNDLNEDGSPLAFTARRGDAAIAELLLDRKANVNQLNNGKTSLEIAFQSGNKETAQLLIDRKADVNLKKAINSAIEGRFAEIVGMLIDFRADVDQFLDKLYNFNGSTSTLLMRAANLGHVEVVKTLLAKNANVHLLNWLSKSALNIAAKSGHTEIVRALLAANANVNTKHHHSLFDEAAEGGHTEIVKILLAANASVNQPCWGNYTPLYYALFYRHIEIMQLLLDSKANVKKISNDDSALGFAVKCSRTEIMQLLLDSEANVNGPIKNGDTPLHLACREGKTEIAQFLLAHNADVNIPSKKGDSPLITAAHYRMKGLVALQEQWIDMNSTYYYPNFISFVTQVIDKGIELVKLLLDGGADVNYQRSDGLNALKLLILDNISYKAKNMTGMKLFMNRSKVSLQITTNDEAEWIFKTLKQYPCFVPTKPLSFGEGVDANHIQKISDAMALNVVSVTRVGAKFNSELAGLFDGSDLVQGPLPSLFGLSDMTAEDMSALALEDVPALGEGAGEGQAAAAAEC